MDVTYKIIGGDGKEYGPVTLEELKTWVTQGRLGPQTQVWRSDTNSWAAGSQYIELQEALAPLAGKASLDGFEAVGFWPRVGAALIDQLILFAVNMVVWRNVARMFGWAEDVEVGPDAANLQELTPFLWYMGRYSVVSYGVKMIYDVLMNGRFGATVGKLIIGARIVKADGSRLGYTFAFVRFLCMIVSDFTCTIGYLLVAFRSDKRALHDLLANTRVIYRR